MDRAAATFQWGAFATGLGVLVGVLHQCGLMPVTRDQMKLQNMEAHAEMHQEYENLLHIDRDLKRLMERAHIEHRGEMVKPVD